MNGRQDDNLFKASIIVVICVYFLLGNFLLDSSMSWVPRFNPSFSRQRPVEVTRYELKFTEINGERLEEPLYFADMRDMLSSDDVYEGKRLINRLGHAVYSNDVVAISALNTELEKIYLAAFESAEYQVVFIDTDPVEKYNTGSFRSERVLSSYVIPLGEPIAAEK